MFKRLVWYAYLTYIGTTYVECRDAAYVLCSRARKQNTNLKNLKIQYDDYFDVFLCMKIYKY